jgi:hypothetical protein
MSLAWKMKPRRLQSAMMASMLLGDGEGAAEDDVGIVSDIAGPSYEPAAPEVQHWVVAWNLAVFRIAIVLAWLATVDRGSAAHYALYPPELWQPRGVWAALGMPHVALTSAWVDVLFALFVVAGLLALLGWKTRRSLGVMLLAGFPLLSYPNFFGHISHTNHLVWAGLLLLASPCGDALALDARAAGHVGDPPPSLAYALPLRLMLVLLGIVYFFPGLWKCVHVGTFWLTPTNFSAILFQKWTELPPTVLRVRIDRVPWLCAAGASATIAFELLFLPAVLIPTLRRRLLPILLVIGVGFHLMTALIMHIGFLHILPCYAAAVDWSGLRDRLTRSARVRTAPTTHRVSLFATLLVGGILIFGNTLTGFLKRDDWPLGCYPTFAQRASAQREMLELVVTMPDATQRTLTEVILGEQSQPSHARGLCHFLMLDDPQRSARLHAFWQVWKSFDPSLSAARAVRAELVTIRTNPDAIHKEVSRRVLDTIKP